MNKIVLTLLAAALFASCVTHSESSKQANNDSSIDTTPEEVVIPPPVKINGDTTEVYIQANDQMKFDQREIRVQEGQVIKLTLDNVGKLAKDIMGHNFVILDFKTDVNDFAAKATNAKEQDYIPLSESSKVIAHTRMTGGGEKDIITFKTPAAGSYDFLCSFPGHAVMMRGKFIVEKK